MPIAPPALNAGDTPNVVQALATAAGLVGAVAKADENPEQGFRYRGIERIMEKAGPALHTAGVVVVPKLLAREVHEVERGRYNAKWRHVVLTIRYRFHGPAGDHVDALVEGEGLDNADKATSKAFTMAYKAALLQVLGIGSGGPDPDGETPPERSDGRHAGDQADDRHEERRPAPLPPSPPEVAAALASTLEAVQRAGHRDDLRAWWVEANIPPARAVQADHLEQIIGAVRAHGWIDPDPTPAGAPTPPPPGSVGPGELAPVEDGGVEAPPPSDGPPERVAQLVATIENLAAAGKEAAQHPTTGTATLDAIQACACGCALPLEGESLEWEGSRCWIAGHRDEPVPASDPDVPQPQPGDDGPAPCVTCGKAPGHLGGYCAGCEPF